MDMLNKRVVLFMRVAEAGSFSAAAQALYLSQPAVSKQMAILERESGIALFDRSGYRPVLTRKGEAFYQECRRLEEEGRRLMGRLQAQERRPLVIGFTGSFENRAILTLVNQFKEREQIPITFLKNTFEQCLYDLLEGRVDVSFGIESTYRFSKEVCCDRLHDYEMCVITSYTHPLAGREWVTVQDIRNEGMICLSPEFGRGFYQDFMASFAKDHITPRIVRETANLDELIFSVSVGEGVAIVSREVVRESEVKPLPLRGSHHQSCYVVAYKREQKNPDALKFISEVKHYFHNLKL